MPHPLVLQLRFARSEFQRGLVGLTDEDAQRNIYHYWYHTGENMAIRQMLGHPGLPQFVGNLDDEASYRPERQA